MLQFTLSNLATHMAAIFLLACTAPAHAQFGVETTKGPQFGEERVQRWKVGMIVMARGGPCGSVYGRVSIPNNWPEQEVRVTDEEFSDNIGRIQYSDLESGVRLMAVTIPQLNPSERATALVTIEVARKTIELPYDPSILRLSSSLPKDVRKCLASSPLIESRSSAIRARSKDIVSGQEGAWATVESIHDWVKANIEHRNSPLKGALTAIQNGYGNHEDLANVFIALCRAAKVPARTVWVPEYCYAEFYLEDDDGKGYWFPCELKEKTEFGVVTEPYPILQKGDNIRVPGKKEPQRFVAEFLTGKAGRGLSRPTVRFVRQLVP